MFVDIYYKMKERFEALKHAKVQSLSSSLDDQICDKCFAMWSLERYIKDSYDLHVFDPMFLSLHEPFVFHEDDEIVEDLGEEQDDKKKTQASKHPFENQTYGKIGFDKHVIFSNFEVYDKSFDNFEMD
jgi:hypothetical protein